MARFRSPPKHSHVDTANHAAKVGVLLVNLGTPDKPDRVSVRRYLKQFLSDPRVVEIPRVLWWMILNLVILTIRPSRSAKAYQSVWTDQGSPLLVNAMAQRDGLRDWAQSQAPNLCIELGMSYGSPSIPTAMQALADAHVERLLIVPLYPQYSGSTTAAVYDAVFDELKHWRVIPQMHCLTAYHDDSAYCDALAASVREHWDKQGRADRLLMSFHGIPQRYFHAGDPYHCHCYKTARLVAQRLQLEPDDWQVTFQSRVGREPWLQPYTDTTIKTLPDAGVKTLDVIAPGFSSDCLETIEEIDEENRGYFMEAGGESFRYIPCLNARPDHITALAGLITRYTQPWAHDITEREKDRPDALAHARRMGVTD